MIRHRSNRTLTLLTVALLAVAFAAPQASAAEPASGTEPKTLARAQSVLDQLPLHFEENLGQLDSSVEYYARSPEHMVLFARNEAILQTASGELRVGLVGAAPTSRLEGLDKLRSYSSYHIGHSPEAWQPRVSHYEKVRYQGVYPGIDLVYYGNKQKLEHDFVISPGADVSVIQMAFQGAQRMEIAHDGALMLDVGGSEMRFSAPYAYSEGPNGERVEVAARYVRTGDREVAFEVGAHDPTRTLVIDPVLSYSTYFGGTFTDVATAVAVDSAGFIYVTGITASSDYPTNGRGLQETGGIFPNGFLVKLDPFAAGPGQGFLYSGYFGGAEQDEPVDMALDADGNIYIVGMTRSTNFPVTDTAIQDEIPEAAKLESVFLVKYNLDADPILLYATYLSGDGVETPVGLALDDLNLVHIVGSTTSIEDFPLTSGAMQTSNRGGPDIFYSVIDTTRAAALIYSTFLGGSSTDTAGGIVVANDGTALLTGFTISENFPWTGNAFQVNPAGNGEAFLTRIDWRQTGLDGLIYSTHIGGSGVDVGNSLALDSAGRVHVTGYTLSQDFPVTAAAIQSYNAGNGDIFVVTLDLTKSGGESLAFGTYVGGSETDIAYKIASDSADGIVVTGYTYSSDFPIVGDYLANTYSGITDSVFLRIDPNKPAGESFTCSSFIGGESIDVVQDLTVDSLDNIYLTGYTWSADFPVSDNAFTGIKPGIVSTFVSKLGPCAVSDTAGTSGDPSTTGDADTTGGTVTENKTNRRATSGASLGRSSRGGGQNR